MKTARANGTGPPGRPLLRRQTLTYTAGVIRRHRAQIGSPWRKLTSGQQGLLVLAYLRKALRDAKQAGHAYVVIDGTLIPIDRVAAGRPFCSGKHHRHGMNLQVIAGPAGDILWVSGPLPGAPAGGPTPSSRPGASCVNSAAARGRPGSSPRPSVSCSP